MANFYNSPGVRVREFDQSIVTPIQSKIPTRGVIFIESDWGPEWQLCETNKEFIRNFGLPSDVKTLEKLSYDQQYKLVGTLPLYVFRLNTGQGQSEQTFEYTKAGSQASQTIGSGDSEVLIKLLEIGDEGNDYTVEVIQGVGNDVPLSVDLTGKQLTVTLGTDSQGELDPAKNAQDLIQDQIQQVTDGVDFVFEQTQQATDPITQAEGPKQFEGGTDDLTVVPFSQKHTGQFGNDLSVSLVKSIQGEYTLTTYLSGTAVEIYKSESLIDLQQQVGDYSQYINLHYDQFEILETEILQVTVTDVNLDGGVNGQNRSPSFYWEPGTLLENRLDFMGLSNKNQFQYRFVIGQGQLDETESNTFQGYQTVRKDFVVITEFLPDSQDYSDWISRDTSQMNIFMRSIANNPQSYMSGYQDNSYLQIYHPWVMENALGGSLIPYPPSVKVMQQFGTMIATGRIWDAAQGISRGKLNVEPYMLLNEDQKDLLYKSSVNPIVKFAGEGTFIWGQKTALTTQSQLNRLNQRLASIEVESSIDWQMRDYIFEPLTQGTFDRIDSRIDGILTNFVNTNAIIQYKYELDTNPQYIDNNYIIINVQFIPTKSLEFIELRFIVKNYSQTL